MQFSLQRLYVVLPLAGVAAACSIAKAPASPVQGGLIVTPYRADADYHLGDKIGWKVSSLHGGKATYTIKLNNSRSLGGGEIDLSRGTGTIETTVNEPGMVLVQITAPTGEKKYYGASVDPEAIRPAAPRPRDFDQFWAGKVRDLKRVPANPTYTSLPATRPGVKFGVLKMDHVNKTHVYGHLAQPEKPGKYPAMLVVQWASPPYPLQPDWAQWPSSQGWIVLNIEPHNVPPNEKPEFYQALPNEIKNYNVLGADNRETSYFVEMYLRGYRAVDYLASLPNWDGKTILVTGGSMGGQQTLAIAGLHPKVTHLMAEEPAGCDTNAPLYDRQLGYPFLSPENPKWRETNPYIDCINFASRIKATALVGIGYIDTVCPPTGIWSAFNMIRGTKHAARMTEAAHNNEATMEQQRAYYDVYNRWISDLAQGKPVTLPRK